MIDTIWNRIEQNEGQVFRQIRGKEFTYKMNGNSFDLSTTNHSVSKSTVDKALKFVPLKSTAPIQHLFAPSYLYALLMDDRIREGNW